MLPTLFLSRDSSLLALEDMMDNGIYVRLFQAKQVAFLEKLPVIIMVTFYDIAVPTFNQWILLIRSILLH